ncbi:hypothetical protein JCM10212_003266 [Sporobolomyces blumeae]
MPTPYGSRNRFRAEVDPTRRRDDDDAPPAEPDDIQRPPGLVNKAPIEFGIVAGLFTSLETSSTKPRKPGHKAELIGKFYAKWRERAGPDLYPLVRLLLPERDTRRRTYNLKEQKLAKAIVSALDIPPDSADARKLINWKVPTKGEDAAGEFATVAEKVILSRSSVITKYGALMVDEVNQVLDEISKTIPQVGPDGKRKMPSQEHARIIKGCIAVMTAREMKWLIRIILRDLKAGVGEKTILSQFHPDAMDVFNTCSDIKRVCWQLYDPETRVPRTDWVVTPNRVFVPMFCHRLQGGLKDVVTMMKKGRPNVDPTEPLEPGAYANDEFLIEEKLDGERIQLHKKGSHFKYYSRKAKDYTYLYGSDKTAGSLTPFIVDLISDEVEDLILDGEMLVWDPNLVRYMPFGNLKTFALSGHSEIEPNDPRPCFKVFDVLYVSGKKTGESQSCLQMPLWRRKAFLQTLFKPKGGVLELADCVRGTSIKDIKGYLENIVEERGEGLVIKHPLSMYCLGARNESWIKVKPEYMDALGETIDAVVVGGYWGEGNRRGGLSSFMVGLRTEGSDGETRYVSFAKVGSGLNREDYSWISQTVGTKLRPVKKGEPLPEWFVTRTEMPDVLIHPSDSFVVEIKAAEIVGGAEYGADMTLRFPRAMRIRHDRSHNDSATLEEVKEMRQGAKKRDLVGEDFTNKRKKARVVRTTTGRAVAPSLAQVVPASEIFAGLTVYVVSGGKKASDKAVVQDKIREHGARLMQMVPDVPDGLVIAHEYNRMVKMKKGIDCVDVVYPAWVLESIEQGRRLPLHKRFVARGTPETIASPVYEEVENVVKMEEDGDGAEPAPKSEEPQSEAEDDEADLQAAQSPLTGPWQPRLGSNALDFDSDGEPDTEDSGCDEDALEDDTASESSGQGPERPSELSAVFLNAMKRNRLDTGSPALDLNQLVGPFSPYTAYFDTSENADKNGLAESRKSGAVVRGADTSLFTAQQQFSKLGGTVTTDLADPELTHIVMTRDVLDRRLELFRRTKEPKLRRIVTQSWIVESAQNGTVLDETPFAA